jgi:hypothetical protein
MEAVGIWYQMLIHSTDIPPHLENCIISSTSVNCLPVISYSFSFLTIASLAPKAIDATKTSSSYALPDGHPERDNTLNLLYLIE